MRALSGRLAALVLLWVTVSCVQLSWQRHDVFGTVTVQQDELLVPGEASLEDCLETCGSPVLVWELSETGYALAYGWDRQREYGLSVSVPVADSGGSASFNYDDVASKLHGIVFVFDQSDVLVRKRRGLLRDLAPAGAKRRPVYWDDER